MLTIKWVPVVNHVNLRCCTCSLRTATLLIAWMGLMVMTIQVMDAACRLYYYREDIAYAIVKEEIIEAAELDAINSDDNNQFGGNPSVVSQDKRSLDEESNKEDKGVVSDDNDKSAYAFLTVSREALAGRLVCGLLLVLVYGSLLFGAWTEKSLFILPYVLVGFCGIVILAISVVVGGVIMIYKSPYEGFLSLLFGVPITLLLAYLWAAVYTYYRELTEGGVAQRDTQLENLTHMKSEQEEEEIINPEEIQKAYETIEYNIQQKQPYAV